MKLYSIYFNFGSSFGKGGTELLPKKGLGGIYSIQKRKEAELRFAKRKIYFHLNLSNEINC